MPTCVGDLVIIAGFSDLVWFVENTTEKIMVAVHFTKTFGRTTYIRFGQYAMFIFVLFRIWVINVLLLHYAML